MVLKTGIVKETKKKKKKVWFLVFTVEPLVCTIFTGPVEGLVQSIQSGF